MSYIVQYGSQPQDPHSHGYIFVVSHMRSFSSLLCHILGSHPEIDGYVETHQSYFGRVDLNRLTRKVSETTGSPVSGRYVLDKMLDDDKSLAPNILARQNVKVLLLVRRADETVNSILNLARARGVMGRFSDAQSVVDYYTTRLEQLAGYGAQLGRSALFLEAERLIDETEQVLDGLAHWLDLGAPLSATYRTFKLSGVAGYGDPSPAIMTGRIVMDAEDRHRSYVPIDIPEQAARRAREAYAACRDNLLTRNYRP